MVRNHVCKPVMKKYCSQLLKHEEYRNYNWVRHCHQSARLGSTQSWFGKSFKKIKSMAKKSVGKFKSKLKQKFTGALKQQAVKLIVTMVSKLRKAQGRDSAKIHAAAGIVEYCNGQFASLIQPGYFNSFYAVNSWDWSNSENNKAYEMRKLVLTPLNLKNTLNKKHKELMEKRLPEGCNPPTEYSNYTYRKECFSAAKKQGIKWGYGPMRILVENRRSESLKLMCAARFDIDFQICSSKCCCSKGPVISNQGAILLKGGESNTCQQWFMMVNSVMRAAWAIQTSARVGGCYERSVTEAGPLCPWSQKKCEQQEMQCKSNEGCDSNQLRGNDQQCKPVQHTGQRCDDPSERSELEEHSTKPELGYVAPMYNCTTLYSRPQYCNCGYMGSGDPQGSWRAHTAHAREPQQNIDLWFAKGANGNPVRLPPGQCCSNVKWDATAVSPYFVGSGPVPFPGLLQYKCSGTVSVSSCKISHNKSSYWVLCTSKSSITLLEFSGCAAKTQSCEISDQDLKGTVKWFSEAYPTMTIVVKLTNRMKVI